MSTVLYKANGQPARYAHTWDSFYKGIDDQGPYYECSFLFDDWTDSDTIPNQMLGKVTLTGGVGGSITRVTPFQHPLSPNLYCRSARVKGCGPPNLNTLGYPGYQQGFIVECVFRASVPEGVMQPGDDPYGAQQIDPTTPILWCTQELDYETENVTTPNNQTKWLSNGQLTGLPARLTIGLTTMRLTFHRVPYLPVAAIRACRGKVNNATFLGGTTGHILYLGASTSREASSDGTVVQRITHIFKDRQIAWSDTIRPDTLIPDTLTTDGTTPIFGSADFTPLIQL